MVSVEKVKAVLLDAEGWVGGIYSRLILDDDVRTRRGFFHDESERLHREGWTFDRVNKKINNRVSQKDRRRLCCQ